MELDLTKLQVVIVSDIIPNTWNPKIKKSKEYEKIKRSISEQGQLLPIIVRENNNKYEIIDGEQRYTAFKELDYKKIVAYNMGEVSDIDAKNITLWAQYSVPFQTLELNNIIAELLEANIMPAYDINEFDTLLDDNILDIEPLLKEQDENGVKTLNIKMSEEAYNIVMQAINKIQSENDNISEARAIELICADYLGG